MIVSRYKEDHQNQLLGRRRVLCRSDPLSGSTIASVIRSEVVVLCAVYAGAASCQADVLPHQLWGQLVIARGWSGTLGWLDLVINVSQTRSKDWIPACTAARHSHCTNMQNTLGYQSAPRIGKKCSGALKNTSHLGQKDARDKRAQGNDGQSAFCRPRERGGRCQRYLPPAWGARIDTRKMSFASTMAINRTATRVTLMERHRSRR